MQRTLSATEARVHFGELLRRVAEEQEIVVVERGGKPQAVVLPVAEYERLLAARQEPEDWWVLVERAREQARNELGDRELPSPDEIIRQMREERDEQLVGLR
jgi:prevent-host-death family protein